MTIINKEIRDFVTGKLAWVATADENGRPNLAPKGTTEVLDEETLVFADLFSLKTRVNLEKNSQVAVAVIEASPPAGYQFKGQAELVKSGPIYDQVAQKLQAAGLPSPTSVVKIKVTEVFSLSPGLDAGRRLA
ncbi:MAG: pyridoxamine 5'-phosphate oxidase family protein [Deltaproteobacteria bacterium]|jgi:predicted pyridoxine 5'-phosphate oxidase superfamily flavin-nucleotide-binding protein|nr:pyridoxamine 5'-phosphate oxidase family protein [Deltaproteobacteria bacterium]